MLFYRENLILTTSDKGLPNVMLFFGDVYIAFCVINDDFMAYLPQTSLNN